MKMTKFGFTGPKSGCDESIVLKVLSELYLTQNDTVVTGACIGLDSQISHLVRKHYPLTKQRIVVPNNRKFVDQTTFANGDVILMPDDTSYRDRNEEMVRLSEKVISFWNGNKRSGTYMTMNIAKRHNKLYKIVDICNDKR